MQLIAEVRSGELPFRELVASPFHGQLVVLLRILFWAGTLGGGMDFTWVRVGIVAAHIAGALGCAALCVRWTNSKIAGWIAASLYAGAAGFVNEVLWWPTSGIFCLGATFLILAIVALNPRARNQKLALASSLLIVAVGTLALTGLVAAALGLALYCAIVMSASRFWRRRAPLIYLAVVLALGIVAAVVQFEIGDAPHIRLTFRGLWLAVWLVGTAPVRFFASWTTFSVPGFITICILAPLAWAPLLGAVYLMDAHERRVVVAIWTPAVLMALLVGMARVYFQDFRNGPGMLYVADRYYYFFLLPLVVHCTLGIIAVRRRFAHARPPLRTSFRIALVFCVGAALFAGRSRFLRDVPYGQFAAASRALDRARLLDRVIKDAVAAQPDRAMVLADGLIPIEGALNNQLTLSSAVYSEFPHGLPGLRITQQRIDSRQALLENELLDKWATSTGLKLMPACVNGGRLEPSISSRVDFRKAPYDQNLVAGFSFWEGGFRWTNGHASLRLLRGKGDLVIEAFAPIDLLRKKWPHLKEIDTTVEVNGHRAGAFSISDTVLRDYRIPVATGPDAVDITLTSDFVWHARDILPQSLDERDLSIALFAIGFGQAGESPEQRSCR